MHAADKSFLRNKRALTHCLSITCCHAYGPFRYADYAALCRFTQLLNAPNYPIPETRAVEQKATKETKGLQWRTDSTFCILRWLRYILFALPACREN